MRLYTNENFYLSAVLALRDLGHDVLTSLDAGQANKSIPDIEVLRYATDAERVLITLNRRDFIRLHASHPSHTGIIVCTEDPNYIALAQRIHEILLENTNMSGRIFRVVRSV